jgi:hypothetical protein
VVVTHEARWYERYDPSLLTQVPRDVTVIRVRSCDPWLAFQERRAVRLQRKIAVLPVEKVDRIREAQRAPFRSFVRELIRTAEAWCYYPDPAMGWIRPAVKAIAQFCAHNKSDILWATGGPWSSFIVAQRASRLTGIPYVLDFRDAWTLVGEPFANKRPVWATRSDRRKLYGLLKKAHTVVFRYKTEAECYWRAYPGALDIERIHIIPNGFDGVVEDYKEIPGEKCKILYTGTLWFYRLNTLLAALSRLKQLDPVLSKNLRLVFVGEKPEDFSFQVEKLALSDIVVSLPPAPHAHIIKLQQESHALLMLERDATIKGYELLAGAKLFGYLKAARPIIGVLPEGEAKNILRTVAVSTIASVDSIREIIDVLRRVLRAWAEGTLSSLVPNPAACAAFSAENQTAALVHALECRPAKDRFVPGLMEIPSSLRNEIASESWIERPDRRTPFPA